MYALCKYRKYYKRVHTNERPYKCGTCELTFKRPGTRANHELKHLKIKPFQCTECKYGTITKQNLRKHMAVKHPRPVLPVLPLYVDVASSVLSYPDADTELESEFEPINVHLVEPLNSKVARIGPKDIENYSNEESNILFEDAFQQDYDYDQLLFSFQDDSLNNK